MPRHLISDAHEWINEIPTVPIYSSLPEMEELKEGENKEIKNSKSI